MSAGHFEDLGHVHPRGLGMRRVRAYVPPAQVSVPAGAPRPLLVMFDGQNVFGDTGSFAGGWRVHEAVARFARARRAAAPIVVAIDHGGTARIDELAPFADARHGGGKLDAVLGAIVDELVPRVHGRFAIAGGPGAHFLGGASLGGLAALYGHLVRPDVFGGAVAMSASLWFTRARLAAHLLRQPRPAHSRVYLDVGARESPEMRAAIAAFARELRVRGWRDAKTAHRLAVRVDARGRHHESAWRRRFPAALRFLLAA